MQENILIGIVGPLGIEQYQEAYIKEDVMEINGFEWPGQDSYELEFG